MSTPAASSDRAHLQKYAWLAIATAIATILLKSGAWWLTGSVGLLSDAAESSVNLVAAVVALYALTVAARPADEDHHFGHTKAEYFSALAEGQMIFIAALFIIWSAIDRLLNPAPLENVGIGLAISVGASVLNGLVAVVLLRAGRRYRSHTLIADGKHLMTDVWTSVGVVIGVLLVAVTGIERLDPIVALAVGLNIVITGYKLLRDSALALIDGAMPAEENEQLASILAGLRSDDVDFHGLRTRVSGHRGFAEVHVLVPGDWSVTQGHDLAERIEQAVISELPDVTVSTHVEPREDPRSYDDYETEIPIAPATP
ncbi:MAG: cation transporter [Phycicoccus sp.]|nr:cation transporter [Phycicoccus sp.]